VKSAKYSFLIEPVVSQKGLFISTVFLHNRTSNFGGRRGINLFIRRGHSFYIDKKLT